MMSGFKSQNNHIKLIVATLVSEILCVLSNFNKVACLASLHHAKNGFFQASVKRNSASRYFAAQYSATSFGKVGAGAFLFQSKVSK